MELHAECSDLHQEAGKGPRGPIPTPYKVLPYADLGRFSGQEGIGFMVKSQVLHGGLGFGFKRPVNPPSESTC